MGKVISAGHICLDITPVFPAGRSYDRVGDLLVPGELIRTEAASVHTGGSVANTGLALKLLGNDVILLGKVGNDAFGSAACARSTSSPTWTRRGRPALRKDSRQEQAA